MESEVTNTDSSNRAHSEFVIESALHQHDIVGRVAYEIIETVRRLSDEQLKETARSHND